MKELLEGIEWRSEGEGMERREQGGDAGQGPAKRVRSYGGGGRCWGSQGQSRGEQGRTTRSGEKPCTPVSRCAHVRER